MRLWHKNSLKTSKGLLQAKLLSFGYAVSQLWPNQAVSYAVGGRESVQTATPRPAEDAHSGCLLNAVSCT